MSCVCLKYNRLKKSKAKSEILWVFFYYYNCTVSGARVIFKTSLMTETSSQCCQSYVFPTVQLGAFISHKISLMLFMDIRKHFLYV